MSSQINRAWEILITEGPFSLLRSAGDQINRWYRSQRYPERYNPKGECIFEKDWDNLIILDACRYDIFSEENDLPGELRAHYSLSSWSGDFIRANFNDRELHDVVVVTANGWYEKIRKESTNSVDIHDLIIVPEGEKDNILPPDSVRANRAWRMPQIVTEYAINAVTEYPNKRILIHYHQPHTPYIGPTGRDYASELPYKFDGKESLETSHNVLQKAYRENLQIALDEVKDIRKKLTGKTVISADHGEFLGERGFPIPVRQYGHTNQNYHKALVKVPWFVLPFDTRKDYKSDPPVIDEKEHNTIDEINQRLEHLGYKV
jgi:hypothetical protein